jgi:predicted RNA binding protein YcfA (HicA-like mRNA interferase family)
MAEQLPQVNGFRLGRILEREGWLLDRQRGSHAHYILRHADGSLIGRVIVPMHRQPIPLGTLRNILRQANMTVDELRALL